MGTFNNLKDAYLNKKGLVNIESLQWGIYNWKIFNRSSEKKP